MKKFITIIASIFLLSVCSVLLTSCKVAENFELFVSTDIQNGKVYTHKQTAQEGEKVRISCLPDAGYKLICYSVDGENINSNTFTMPNKNVEISAVFEAITYRIEYVFDGGTVDGNNPVTYTVNDDNISLIAPHKDGFDFGAWYYYFGESMWYLDELEDFKTDNILQGTTGKLTLYAHYFNSPREIIIDDTIENGCIHASTYTAIEGETIYLYCEVYSYYEFVCFTVDGVEIEEDYFVMPNYPVTVSAKLKPITYNITYILDGGTNSPENPTTFNVETNFELQDASREGYYFIGWFYYYDGDYTYIVNLADLYYFDDITLYAEYMEIID